MRHIMVFLRFWYDFIVGDDWRVATGIAVGLGAHRAGGRPRRQRMVGAAARRPGGPRRRPAAQRARAVARRYADPVSAGGSSWSRRTPASWVRDVTSSLLNTLRRW
jgi:hypothetical protein